MTIELYRVNDLLSQLANEFDVELSDDVLNELTHHVAGVLGYSALVAERKAAFDALVNTTVDVRIEGTYENGHEYARTVTVGAPTSDLDDWWVDVVFPYTGSDTPETMDLNGVHTCTITRSTDPRLLGLEYEFNG